MKQFRSVSRQLRRGNLKFKFRKVFNGKHDSHGSPVFDDVPYIVRKANNGSWVYFSENQ